MDMRTLAILAGAGALAAVGAVAGDKAHQGDWEASLEKTFNAMDVDGDGNVVGDEFLAYKAAQARIEWERWSAVAGDDAAVSYAEAKAHMEAQLTAAQGPSGADG